MLYNESRLKNLNWTVVLLSVGRHVFVLMSPCSTICVCARNKCLVSFSCRTPSSVVQVIDVNLLIAFECNVSVDLKSSFPIIWTEIYHPLDTFTDVCIYWRLVILKPLDQVTSDSQVCNSVTHIQYQGLTVEAAELSGLPRQRFNSHPPERQSQKLWLDKSYHIFHLILRFLVSMSDVWHIYVLFSIPNFFLCALLLFFKNKILFLHSMCNI